VLWLSNSLLSEVFTLNSPGLAFRIIFSPFIIYVSITIAVLTVLISAWLPARRAAKTSPIDAIRQSKDIQIRSKKLKTSRSTQLLFGFEGTLAAKSLKRSRAKYRATVVSITVSIILFVTMSSFIWVLNKGVEMEYGGYDFDIVIYAESPIAKLDAMEEVLYSIPDAEITETRRTSFQTIVPDGFMTLDAPVKLDREDIIGECLTDMTLYPMPDAEFIKLLPITSEPIPAILVNTATYKHENKEHEVVPYNCSIGTRLPLITATPGKIITAKLGETYDTDNSFLDLESNRIGSVTIGKVINEIPKTISAPLFSGYSVNVFIPESLYRTLILNNEEMLKPHSDTHYTVLTSDPEAFSESARELLALFFSGEGEWFVVENISQMTRLNRNITLLVKVFGYGFIGMLSLIAVTSVISTISTGMALRRQEFAMLHSAGMTPVSMKKMLNLESLLYGLKSLMIGLPIGIALSYLIYKAMSLTVKFAYQLPISAILISAASVMLLTFGTMRYGKRKLGKISIVEAIRNEVT
jgi:putative ABC transport system permease protein